MQLVIGQQVHWHKIVSNYGHVSIIRGTIRKIGKRVTIEVPLMGGGIRLTSVRPENLRDVPLEK